VPPERNRRGMHEVSRSEAFAGFFGHGPDLSCKSQNGKVLARGARKISV
jgi:hypothetical protein